MKILSMRISSVMEDGDRQVVELKADGSLKVTHKLNKKLDVRKRVEPALAGSLMEQVYGLRDKFEETKTVAIRGWFTVSFTTEEGREKYLGPEDMYFVEEEEISQVLRDSLGLENVLLMDGNRRWIVHYGLEYHRDADVTYADGFTSHVNMTELILLDVVEHVLHVSTAVEETIAVRQEVLMAEDVFASFFSELQDLELEGTNEEDLPDSNDIKVFESRIVYSNGEEVVTRATFDADHLPKDYIRLTELISNVLQGTRVGTDTLFSDLPERNSKKKGQVLLCTVMLPQGERQFYSNDDSVQSGTYVEVPIGKNGRTSTGVVLEAKFVDKSRKNYKYILGRVMSGDE